MAAGRAHTLNVLLWSALGIIIAIRLPLLPIRNETKRQLGYPPDSLLNVTELATRHGYQCEEHNVVTEDGFVLTVFRVSSGQRCSRTQIPVLLVHGLLQSADSWLDAGPGSGLAYLLADACHDVWLSNTRGNYYSRRHLTLDPDSDAAYWNFSADEIGYFDLPAILDYVLNRSRADILNYVGFSQGAGTFFIMCSERPNYCEKIKLMIALAPATRQTNTKSTMYRRLTQAVQGWETLLTTAGLHEIFSKGALSQEFVAFFCHFTKFTEGLCDAGLNKFNSVVAHPGSMSNETTRVLFGHFPAGTSLHNMAKYGQAMTNDKFVKFNYGHQKNLELYGTSEPPEYNISAVSPPVVVIYGENDGLVDTKDVEWAMERLPNVLEAVLIKDPAWNHMSVTYSSRVEEIIFPKINEYLQIYSST
ncbi:lipase 1 [Bombyx mori]|uniref:Lipase n=1 Tax=Bombyx mori TaxID=7091 RepID=A0A8R2DKU2_BOMMO|nr:lipase 1 [Bombyx mori]